MPQRPVPRHAAPRIAGTAVALLAAGLASAARPDPAVLPDMLLSGLAPEVARPALAAIPDPGRRLLALRSYVRSGSTLEERWSWTEAQIAAFQGSPEQEALLAEVAAIGADFAGRNPGYEIYANTKVRSLDVQIEHWNDNDSVGAAGEEILAAWTAEICPDADAPCAVEPEEARVWLSGFAGTVRASLAAPGLTRHGQAHAIDFQVMKDGTIVAGADMAEIETVWRAEGWDARLAESVAAAGPSFEGPLTGPDEPWHYDYRPAPVDGAAPAE